MTAVALSHKSPRVVGRAPYVGASDTEANAKAFSKLNTHLRRDVGVDDAHCRTQTNWQDPLEVEIRRLH